MYIFCPLTKSFDVNDSRPLFVPHEYIQPIEITIVEYIHNTKNNHNIYNVIPITRHEFALDNEDLKIIRALELLWPLLQTKNINRMLAKLITSSDTSRYNFPNGILMITTIRKFSLKFQLTNKIKHSPFLLSFFKLHRSIILKKILTKKSQLFL